MRTVAPSLSNSLGVLNLAAAGEVRSEKGKTTCCLRSWWYPLPMWRLVQMAATSSCVAAVLACGGQISRSGASGSDGNPSTMFYACGNGSNCTRTYFQGNSTASGGAAITTYETLTATAITSEYYDGGRGLGDATIIADSSYQVVDGPVIIDVAPPPQGLAGFAFVVNGVVQTPMSCPSDNWEFSPAPNGTCGFVTTPPFACPGITSVVLVNTGQVPMAYIAAALWSGQGYVPGVLTGDPYQLAGVLDPGGQVDITSVYNGGTVAALGSSEPFSFLDANYAGDEGTIPWPGGVSGSEGATQMQLAEVEVRGSCTKAPVVW